MEKNKTLQEVYKNSSEEVREILKSKFSYSDLGIINVEQEIRNGVLGLIKNNIKNVRFLNKNGGISDLPTNRVEILDENGSWLFDINYDEENKHFWYSHYNIYRFFESKCGINYQKFNEIMVDVVEEDLNMKGVTPPAKMG